MLIAVWAAAAAFQWAPALSADAASAPSTAASRDCEACPEMVSIPGGEFLMGSPASESVRDDDGLPQRPVRAKPFALGKTEVTVAQWRQFATASGYLTEAERKVYEAGCFTWKPDKIEWAWRAGRNWRGPGWRQEDSEPVVCISWTDAQAYVRWLNQNSGVKGWRLPTEAERTTAAPTKRTIAGAAWCAAVPGTPPLTCCARPSASG